MKYIYIVILLILNSSCSKGIIKAEFQRDFKIEQEIEKINFFLYKKDYQTSLKLTKKILKNHTDNDFYYIISNLLLAKTYFFLKDYNNSLKYIEKSFQITNIYKFPKYFPSDLKKTMIIGIYHLKGQLLLIQGKRKLAFNSLIQTLKLAQNAKLYKKNFVLGEIFKNLGTLFFLNNEYHQAISYYNQALYYEKKNKNNLYKHLLKIYIEILSKYYDKSNSFEATPFLYGSNDFNKAVTLYQESFKYLKENNSKKALIYLNKALNSLDTIKNKDKIRSKILLAYINNIKGSIFFKKSRLTKAYIFYKNAYTLYQEAFSLIEKEEIYRIKHNSLNSDSEENEFILNEFYARKYLFKEQYLNAYKYGSKMLNYYLKKDIKNRLIEIRDSILLKSFTPKLNYINNNISFLNTISLTLSINYSYKNSIKCSAKNSKDINNKSFTQWINYKGMEDSKEYEFHISSEDISTKLSKNQLYIDIVSGSRNYYVFTLDYQNNISFEKISREDTDIINKHINANRDINQKIAESIKNENLSDTLESQLEITTQQYMSILAEIIFQKYLSIHLKNKKSLIISPDGLLNFLPFEALYHNGKYLIEDYKISYISSGREFVRQTKRKKANPKYKMICFGNPDFNASLPISRIKGRFGGNNQIAEETWEQFQNFSSIGNAEIVTIKNLYENAIIYEGKEATLENFMSVDSSKILHVSTHGKFLNNESIQNPMLKVGLAFSSANDRTSLSGILTASQISDLDLQDTELVVLSACESGLGEIYQTKRVKGLPKAFIEAGARNVIMSLWSVSTKKTAMLMKSFYENIQNGQDYETALRNAKLKMIDMHPYYWSTFIMHGIQN